MSGIVLALDTATRATAAAVLVGDDCVERRLEGGAGRPAHAGGLLPLAAECLAELGCGFGDVDRVAVCVGPGSFTGIRAGVATAAGLARGCGADLVGVGSLRALLAGAREAGIEGPLVAAIDARRRELFLAGGDADGDAGAACVLPLSWIEGFAAGGRTWVGDGALLARDAIELQGGFVPPEEDRCHRILASVIAGLASSPDVNGDAVAPVYLRKPDAVPAGGS